MAVGFQERRDLRVMGERRFQMIGGRTMKEENCIFCRIANGEIPTNTIYEDETFRVILDTAPAARGHALILPKDHYENLLSLPEDTAAEAIRLAGRIAARQMDRLQADGLNMIQNNGAAAGQTVPHFHIHLIPRYEKDGQKIGWNPGNPSAEELAEVREILQ